MVNGKRSFTRVFSEYVTCPEKKVRFLLRNSRLLEKEEGPAGLFHQGHFSGKYFSTGL